MEIGCEVAGVREDLRAAQGRYRDRLARAGANWSGAERVAIAHEARPGLRILLPCAGRAFALRRGR